MSNPAIKSPFYVVPNFISPKMCEEILDLCDFTVPDQDAEGKEVFTSKTQEAAEEIIYDRFSAIRTDVMNHYGLEYKGTERTQFEWYPEGTSGTMHAENSKRLRKKWVRVFPADLTCVLFLTSYQDQPPIETDYEVFGGKLEFPQHKFGFNPQRGTLVVFPSDPHFINANALVKVGDLYQARFNIVAKTPLFYDMTQFPGNYTMWFSHLS